MTESGTADAWRERLRAAREVRIETEASDGRQHSAIIWIVVDDAGRLLVRSWRGSRARWYREAISGRPVRLALEGETLPVTVDHAADDERIAATSRLLEAKYADSASTPSMLRDEILDTTLELHPAP